MAGFGLPNFGQLTEAFKKAKEIQQNAQKLQDELESMEIEGKSDDEMIKVWISGNQVPLRVEVNEKISNSNKEEIEKNILEAISLLSPGRGLRNSKFSEMVKDDNMLP